MQASISLFHRVLTATAGLFIGGLLGMLALYYAMLLVGSDFGMDNVRPGAVLGAVIGVRRSGVPSSLVLARFDDALEEL